MKKLLSILLCLALALSLGVGALASGEASGGAAAAEPTVTAAAEANPDQAITLDGVAMGQVRRLVTTASLAFDGGEADEAHSTRTGVMEKDGVTYITSAEENTVGVAIRNTGAFVLGGGSDPALVAEKINFSYITSSYYPDWSAFCDSLGYDAGMSLEEIAQTLVDSGSTARYTNLGLAAPETVALSDYVIDLAGVGTNDMGGFGAAVYVSDNAVADLSNFRVITRGPGRGTLFTRFAADVTVNGSTFYAVSDPDLQTMQGCPPGLFLEGKIRATNAVGGSHVTYNDSVVISQGWGALSTDSDDLYTDWENPTELHVNDSYIAVITSGYGAYSDGGARDYFTGCAIDVPDYAAVETGGGVVYYENCYINSGEYGVMTHSGNSVGEITFIDTELHVGEAGVMLRDTANTVTFDNCTIAFDGTYTIDAALAASYGVDMADVDEQFGTVNGVDESYVHTIFRSEASQCIAKLIHNSDGGSGTERTGAAPTVTIRNSVMSGNILNTAAMTGDEYTATSGPAGEGIRTPRSLIVTLDNAAVTGAISLGSDEWAVTHFASGNTASQEIGYADDTVLGMFREDNFGLSLALENGAVWTVTEDSYLTALTVDGTSSIVGADGKAVSMTVDGVATPIAAGTYEGEIVVYLSDASGEASSSEPASAEAAPAAAEAEEALPATDGTENQSNTLAGGAQPATAEEYDGYEAYLREFMTAYDGVGDGTFDDGARSMALGELDSVSFGADVNAFPFEMYVTQFGALSFAEWSAQ